MLSPRDEIQDPSTASERLAELAYAHPELGPAIAAHPNAYLELREWIATYATPAEAAASDPAPPAGPPRGRRFWTRTKVIVSGTIALVGTVASVISIIPILTRDATNFSHLTVSAVAVEDDVTEWALPPEALDLDFPAADEPCGASRIDWLKEHAKPLHRSFVVSARNSASEGAMLALTEFRSTEEGAAERGPVNVRLVCDPTGSPPEEVYYGRLLADEPTSEATQARVRSGDPASAIPEVPIAYNLAPGESGKIPLELFSRNPVSGKVQMTVLSRSESRTVEIDGSEFEMPALLYGGDMYLFTTAEGLECQRVENNTLRRCSMEELRHEQSTARS